MLTNIFWLDRVFFCIAKRLFVRLVYISILVSLAHTNVLADGNSQFNNDLFYFQKRWAEISYLTRDEDKEVAFEQLAGTVRRWSEDHTERAEAHIWKGVILSTYAGEKGGLGALSLVKEAKKSLEHAIRLDPNAMEGSAYTSLGSLYYQVPGWPFSFGDNDKAREYLTQALEINPNGIEPNYFYADFLMETGHEVQAKIYFEKALNLPLRKGHSLTDTGRRREIEARLEQLGHVENSNEQTARAH